jgi:hypothetical protein
MKKYLSLLTLVFASGVALADPSVIVMAHLTGENYGKVDTNIIVTAAEQKVFHFHSDVQGGGTWYDAFISIKDGTILIVERDSVSGPYKTGEKVTTTEQIFRLSADKIANEKVELSHGNRMVLTRSANQRPTTVPTVPPSAGASGGQ